MALALPALIASAANASSRAPTPAAAPEPLLESTDVVVTGARPRYATETSGTATRTPTAILDIPQAITAISRQQIDDQAQRSIADILRFVPGAIAAQGEGNRDQVVLRGNNSTADFFVDGLRDDVQYYRPLYNLERLEVLRGPNALSFGRGGGGGIINRVTKAPERGASILGGDASADSFGAWYVDADMNAPLSGNFVLRINGLREELANHRRGYGGHVTAINPVARLFGNAGTSATIGYEYVDDDRVVDRGIPSAGGQPVTGFRDGFFGAPGVNRTQFTGNVGRISAEHRFSDALSLTGRLLYGDYHKYYRNAFPSGAVAAGRVPVQAYWDFTDRRNLFSQTDLMWRVSTGPIAHALLAGVEFSRQDTAARRLNGFFDGAAGASADRLTASAPLADPFVIPAIIFRSGAGERNTMSRATIFAGYIQDQIKFGPVELLIGVRHDRFALDVANRLTGQRFARSDALWSPRAGLVVHPVATLSLYLSYARSYLPQSGDQFTTLDVTTAALAPEKFDNYELGAKWAPHAGLLIAADIYQLDRTNTRAAGPVPGTTVLTGAQRSRGFELEARGTIAPNWELSFGYAYQDARIAQTTTAAPAGRRVALVPQHSVAAFSRVNLSTSFGVGLGVSYFSDRFASISNAVTLPGYARVDAALYYKLTKRVELQVNVENLFDAGYFPTAHTDNNISTGAPINARATLRFRL